jgi:hypothetical protein
MGIKAGTLPQKFVEKMSDADRKSLGLRSNAEKSAAIDAKSEAEIQRTVENYLRQLGYESRTPDNIMRGKPRSGWFVHIHEAKKNPILLDLLILSNNGKFMELELKTSTGRIRPEQEKLLSQHGVLARSSIQAIEQIKEWHEWIHKMA